MIAFRNGHGKIAFAELGRAVYSRWKLLTLAELAYYQQLSEQDKVRNRKEMKAWKASNKALSAQRLQDIVSQTRVTASNQDNPTSGSTKVDASFDDADFDRAVDAVLPPEGDTSLLPLEDVTLMPLTEPLQKPKRNGAVVPYW
jgi:hypothetical protein